MARFEDFWHIINPWEFLDSNIKEMADYVNNKLIEFNDSKFYNHWFVLDFPSYDVIRKIYNGNDLNRSYRSIATNLKLSGVSMDMDDLNLDLSLQDSKVPEYNRDLNIYYDSYYYFSKSEITQLNGRNIATNNCIQRKFQKTKSNNNNNNSKMQKKKYIVKTDFKCAKNSRNQWYFKPNNDYVKIVSALDDQCLFFKNNTLQTGKCHSNSIYEDFITKNKTLCSRADENYCLDGYKTLAAALESMEEKNSKCPFRFIRFGYPCCSDSAEIILTDEMGSWGYENGGLCGIPYDTLDLLDTIE